MKVSATTSCSLILFSLILSLLFIWMLPFGLCKMILDFCLDLSIWRHLCILGVSSQYYSTQTYLKTLYSIQCFSLWMKHRNLNSVWKLLPLLFLLLFIILGSKQYNNFSVNPSMWFRKITRKMLGLAVYSCEPVL